MPSSLSEYAVHLNNTVTYLKSNTASGMTESHLFQAELRILQRVFGSSSAATRRVPPPPGKRRAGSTFHPGYTSKIITYIDKLFIEPCNIKSTFTLTTINDR